MNLGDETRSAVLRFHKAVNDHDVDAVAAAITEDCHFESTQPPDGDAHHGSAAITAFFGRLFDSAVARTFDIEELILLDDRAIMRWNHSWTDSSGASGHVRGVDIFTVRGGKVAEKLSYVKG